MKLKYLKGAAVLALVLSLAGCTVEAQGIGETTTKETQHVFLETENLDKPPELHLPAGQGDAIANLGTYCWNYDCGNGKWSAVCCDSIHPLQSEDLLEPLTLDYARLELVFGRKPTTVEARRWPDTAFGSTEAKSKRCTVEDLVLTLAPGGNVYEVKAVWEQDGENAYGEASYVFYAVLEEDHGHTLAEQPQTVADPVIGYCGNTMTTLYIGNESHTFMGGNSVTLTDILINLDYSEYTCRCPAENRVDTEFGIGYEINLTQGFARCEKGQAALTEEQIEIIAQIILEEGKRE